MTDGMTNAAVTGTLDMASRRPLGPEKTSLTREAAETTTALAADTLPAALPP